MVPELVVVLLGLALIGFLVWALVSYVPMPEAYRRLVVLAAIVLTVLWLLARLGVLWRL